MAEIPKNCTAFHDKACQTEAQTLLRRACCLPRHKAPAATIHHGVFPSKTKQYLLHNGLHNPNSPHFAAPATAPSGRRAGAAKCGDDWLWSVRSVAFRSSGRRIGRTSAIRTHIRQHTAPPWALMRLFSVKISQNRRRHGKIQCILNCPQPPF